MSQRTGQTTHAHNLAGYSRRGFLVVLGSVGAAAAAGLALWRFRPEPPASPGITTPPAPATPPPPPDTKPIPLPTREPTVRVRVFSTDDQLQGVAVGRAGQWLQVVQAPPQDIAGTMEPTRDTLRGPLRVRMGQTSWSVMDNSGLRASISNLDPFEITPLDDDETIDLGDRTFPNVLRIVARSDRTPAAFDVVNHVPMEAYLPGVVARELYNHWHEQTHAAQAIAARSFACAEHAHFQRRRHFDLTDTQSSQVYSGTVTHETSLDAVARTRGVVISHEDHLVPGYYSSCCGGFAAAAIDAIGPNPVNDIEPLHGRRGEDVCIDSSPCTWQAKQPVDLLTRRLVAYGKANDHEALAAMDTVTAITPSAHNHNGRPTRFVITDAREQKLELDAGEVRRAVNHHEPGLHEPIRPLRSAHVTVSIDGEHATFDGRGHGHGVGMCQHGAERLANDGMDHVDILQWYYPGAEMVQAYT